MTQIYEGFVSDELLILLNRDYAGAGYRANSMEKASLMASVVISKN
jgi:hypothetical protein